MSTLNRYISSQANKSIAVILLTLTALISLFGLYEELDESEISYGMRESLSFIFSTMPRRLDEVLIYSAFLGYLITLGRFAETHELTVMRTSGLSPARIMRALLPSLLLWVVANIVISEFVAPQMDRKATADKIQAQFGGTNKGIEVGLWIRLDDLYMQVQAIDENGDIWGISQYHVVDGTTLSEVLTASSGQYSETTKQWLFKDVRVTSLGDAQARTEHFPEQVWANEISPEVLGSRAFLDPAKMSMLTLYQQIGNDSLGLVSEHEIAFWQRVLKPLFYFSMCFFALAVVLGPLREVGAGTRVTFGIFAGLGFKYLQDLFAPAAIVFQIPAWLGVSIPLAFCTVIAILIIRRNA